jgi:hypothetical protein
MLDSRFRGNDVLADYFWQFAENLEKRYIIWGLDNI